MTPRKRLSNAMARAVRAAQAHQDAQNEMHDAFFAAFGFDLELESLGGEAWVDALVYGHAPTPSLSDIDAAVRAKGASNG